MKRISVLLTALFVLGLAAGCARTPAATQPSAANQADASFETLKPLAMEFVDQLAKGDYAGATSRYDDAMKKSAPEPKLKEIWEQLLGQVGAYQKQTGTHTTQAQGYRIVFVTTQFEKALIDVQVVFNKQDQISGLFFKPAASFSSTPQAYNPPDYVKSGSFHESKVTVGSGEWALPGILSLPEGSGPFPAVVLVHGSGPNDRDETIGPNKPFLDLAWGLASQGIAVLRYDKRTKAHASQFTPDLVARLTVKEETTDDALLAVQLLRQTQGINPKRVYVLGHSLGAMLAPRIGQQDPALAGLIILAAPARPLEDVTADQFEYLFNLDGSLTDQEKTDLQAVQTQAARVKDPSLSANVSATELPLGISAAYWLDLRGYQPAEVAKNLAMPLLVLQGGRDYQVSAAKDFEGWKAALAGKANTTLKLYPELNHLFISGQGPSTPAEYEQEGHVSPDVVADIAKWIQQ